MGQMGPTQKLLSPSWEVQLPLGQQLGRVRIHWGVGGRVRGWTRPWV